MKKPVAYKITTPVDRYSHEHNDCSVKALSNAFNVSYAAAHSVLKEFGRKDRHGVAFSAFMMTRNNSELFGQKFEEFVRPGMTIGTFVNKFNKGSYIIRYTGHVFAVVNGVILDSFKVNSNKRILNYWKIGSFVHNTKRVTQKSQIVELAAQGLTIAQIVEKTGIRKINVQWYFSKLKFS